MLSIFYFYFYYNREGEGNIIRENKGISLKWLENKRNFDCEEATKKK